MAALRSAKRVIASLDGLGAEFVLTSRDVAAIMHIAPETATELCATGKIRGAFRVGRLWRITARNLRAHMVTSTM